MKLTGIELRRISMPLVAPFRTSFGTETERDVLLVRAVTPDAEGWGECVAMSGPFYSSEYVDAAADVLRRFLVPMLSAAGSVGAHAVAELLAPFKGHRMAKAALEMAVLDAELRHEGRSFARELGAVHDRVPCGVSVGIMDSIPELVDAVGGYLDEGYVRIKLKIEPGWDVEPVRAVRERYGDEVLLQVDANTAYTLADAQHLARLDPFDLLLIEQPLDEEDIVGHADLARLIRTPVCLDESIESARAAAAAIRLGACRIVNVKPGRVGGYLEARRIHDVCVAPACRSGAAACSRRDWAGPRTWPWPRCPDSPCPATPRRRVATTPPTSPSRSCSTTGTSPCPTGPGLGVAPLPDRLAEVTTSTEWLASDARWRPAWVCRIRPTSSLAWCAPTSARHRGRPTVEPCSRPVARRAEALGRARVSGGCSTISARPCSISPTVTPADRATSAAW